MGQAIAKDTFDRLHNYSCQGEKHDSLINRLIDDCKTAERNINMSDETVSHLQLFTGCTDINEALNVLMDKYEVVMR